MTEVVVAIQELKSGKAAGENEIQPEMLKALNENGVHWLARVFQVVWELGKTQKDRQTVAIIPLYEKGKCKEWTDY